MVNSQFVDIFIIFKSLLIRLRVQNILPQEITLNHFKYTDHLDCLWEVTTSESISFFKGKSKSRQKMIFKGFLKNDLYSSLSFLLYLVYIHTIYIYISDFSSGYSILESFTCNYILFTLYFHDYSTVFPLQLHYTQSCLFGRFSYIQNLTRILPTVLE